MDVEEGLEGLSAEGSERRIMPRCAVDEEATLLLVHHGLLARCRLVELSLDGCRMNAVARPPAGILVRVEASFKVRGVGFRFSGLGKWTNGQNLVGIRFVDMPTRRRDELAAVLCELEAENAVEAERLAAESANSEKQAAERLALEKLVGQKPVQKRAEVQAARTAKRERRVQSRHEVDTSAMILLVNVGSWLQGRILDLSRSGCRIRTDERFPVGIYTRVETEFLLEGLPFRLGGVIQAIHDRNHVGIRFLDVSDRKRAQVDQLIEEIEELRASRSPAALEEVV